MSTRVFLGQGWSGKLDITTFLEWANSKGIRNGKDGWMFLDDVDPMIPPRYYMEFGREEDALAFRLRFGL
jgi:hypothetical protein